MKTKQSEILGNEKEKTEMLILPEALNILHRRDRGELWTGEMAGGRWCW